MSRQLRTLAAHTPVATPKAASAPSGLLQRQCACGNAAGLDGDCGPCRATALQRPPAATQTAATVPPIVHDVLQSPGLPLDPGTRADMEPRFGHDFSRVRVHTDARAAESARAVSANAYTVGDHVAFGSRRYAPDTTEGRRLLAHELTHVVQQAGHAQAQPGALSISNPHDPAEREADRAAAAVTAGGMPSAPTAAPMAVARDVDAGTPVDAGPTPTPMDAGPAKPGSKPKPTPTPAPAPAAPPTATIAPVTFRGSNNRIAPTRTASVAVTLAGMPSGATAAIDVEGSGGNGGSATITAGASLTGSGNVTVRGDTQTTPGNAGTLRIRATVGSAVIGRSAGFTVAAWPADFTTSRVADIDSGGAVGVAAANAWVSDGSALAELDEVERSERVDIGSRDNPPFTSGAGTSTTSGTSGFIAGTASPTTDRHSYGRRAISIAKLSPGMYTLVYRQNFIFNDRRTGVTDAVVQNSGFTITHRVWFMGPTGDWAHDTTKAGAAVTVAGRAATAGSGSASSDTHVL